MVFQGGLALRYKFNFISKVEKMKKLNMQANSRNKQAGFTIIELVVVILLLGILTATALPRFIDLTDEAHAAVVDATFGGLNTGVSLFRAQWTGKGRPAGAGVAEFGDGEVWPNTAGYPVSWDETLTSNAAAVTGVVAFTTPTSAVTANECASVYEGVLQAGAALVRPISTADDIATIDAALETEVEAAAALTTGGGLADFIAVPNIATATTACTYIYVGQFRSGAAAALAQTVPTIVYDSATGRITRGTYTMNNT